MNARSVVRKIYDRKLIYKLNYKIFGRHILFEMPRPRKETLIPLNSDENIAYLIGVIMGDGTVRVTRRKMTKYPRTNISIFNSSFSYLNRINSIMFHTFGCVGKIQKKRGVNCYILSINNKVICLFFLKVVGLKSGKKVNLKIPDYVKTKRLFKHFLAGLLDTDGFFTDSFGIMLNGKNFDFLKEIMSITTNFYGIHFRKLYLGSIMVNGNLKIRCQVHISSRDTRKCMFTIPLKHDKFDKLMGPPGVGPGSPPCKGGILADRL